MGGMKKAILLGIPQNEILESAYKYQKEVEEGERIIVGKISLELKKKRRLKGLKWMKSFARKSWKLEYFRKIRDFNETSTSTKNIKKKKQKLI